MDNNRLNTYFFELLQVAIGNRDTMSGALTPEEWEEIYEIVKKQTLVGIAFKGVERLPKEQMPPMPRVRQWFVKADKIRKKNEKMNLECAKTCFALQKAGFHSCIIKGQSNQKNYGNGLCWYRTPGDIDVWAWSDSGKVSEVISYFMDKQKDADPHYHHIDCNDITETETEIHYRPSWMSAPWRNKVLQEFCDRCKSDMGRYPVVLPDGRKTFFFVPSIEFDAVYQLVHIYRHLFAEGIGLRQMMDYCMVLQQLKSLSPALQQTSNSPQSPRYRGVKTNRGGDNFRSQETMKVLSDLGMKRFAAATMWVMQEVFGMKDEYLLCAPNEKRGRYLLNEIMLAGNFGHSDERYTTTREDNAAKWGVMKLIRNMKFLTSYPEEVLCEPLFRVYHWAWRTFRLWRF